MSPAWRDHMQRAVVEIEALCSGRNIGHDDQYLDGYVDGAQDALAIMRKHMETALEGTA